MIFPSNRVRIMVATKPIDFRKGHDSLAAMVKNELRKDLNRAGFAGGSNS
jgi:transposase